MYISFFYFEVRVINGDFRVVIFARIRIDNLPVHLGYNGTSNGSRVNLQLLKEGLNGVNRQPSNSQKIYRQPSKSEYLYRQPSNERAKISRQFLRYA